MILHYMHNCNIRIILLINKSIKLYKFYLNMQITLCLTNLFNYEKNVFLL